MKTYEPRRNNACPNGVHADYDPDREPADNECTCPWLVVASTTPVNHLTSWNRRELQTLIRETDGGYFDPPGYPRRVGSMFLSPPMQRLIDLAEKEPVAAAAALLAGAAVHGDSGLPPFDAIAWDAQDGCLSLRAGDAGWRRLWLGPEGAHTDHDTTTAGGTNPILLWADHPDTYTVVGMLRLFPDAQEPSGDVYAEDLDEHLPQGQTTGTQLAVLTVDAEDIPGLPQAPDANPLADGLGALLSNLPRRTRRIPGPIPQAAGDDEASCGHRGWGPDTYQCSEHPADT